MTEASGSGGAAPSAGSVPSGSTRAWPARLGALGISLLALCIGAWTLAALWYQAAPSWRGPLMGVAGLASAGLCMGAWVRPWRTLGFLILVTIGVAWWWGSIVPAADRAWDGDVSRGVTAEISGSRVTLHDVRDFRWRTPEDFTPAWRSRSFDLDQLDRVDLYSSVWSSPAIAHTLVGFGFSDGQYVVFSAEIRREKGELFSEIGGFFKEFELVLIAAEPDDIIHLRTDARGEHVTRYPLKLTPQQMRAAFLIFAQKGNALARQPEFYQTLTTNCTTVVFQLARLVEPGIPFDWRILLSGYVPGYLYDHGLVDTSRPLEALSAAATVAPGTRPWNAPWSAAP